MKAFKDAMTDCPKCGCGIISGPTYVEEWGQPGKLARSCQRCGYTEYTKTRDAND